MAKGHTYFWRKAGRRDEERTKFAALMREVEKVRIRKGWTKRALAAQIGASEDALHNWVSGRALYWKDLELLGKSSKDAIGTDSFAPL